MIKAKVERLESVAELQVAIENLSNNYDIIDWQVIERNRGIDWFTLVIRYKATEEEKE